MKNKISPFLWFDKDMQGILDYYQDIFKENFKVVKRNKVSDTPSGDVEVVEISLFGNLYTFMTAGPYFKFNEAFSIVVNTEDQDETDYFWNAFTKEGKESQCGWCKDKYGLSWQIVPRRLNELTGSPDKEISNYATQAMLKMKKIIIKDLEK